MEDTQHWTDLFLKNELIQAVRNGNKSLQIISGDINRQRYPGYDDGDPGYHYDVNTPSSLKRIVKMIDPDAKVEVFEQQPKLTNTYRKAIEKLESRMEATTQRRSYVLENARRAEAEGDIAEHNRMMEYIDDYDNEIADYQRRIDQILAPQKFTNVEFTPKMIEVISKGLPRFEQGGRVGYASGGGIRDVSVDELQRMFEG
jgi:hypothetical protein